MLYFKQLIETLAPNTIVKIIATEGANVEMTAIFFAAAIEAGKIKDFAIEYMLINCANVLVVYASCEMD